MGTQKGALQSAPFRRETSKGAEGWLCTVNGEILSPHRTSFTLTDTDGYPEEALRHE